MLMISGPVDNALFKREGVSLHTLHMLIDWGREGVDKNGNIFENFFEIPSIGVY